MAKFKAFYASEGEIPQFARDNNLYVNRNGRWEFDHSEFSDLEDLTSPGLASNRDKLKDEKVTAQAALVSEKKRADDAEAELRKVQKPGTKVLSGDEVKQFEEYQKLGAPKDLEKIKSEHADLQKKVTGIEGEKSLRQICDDTKLNFDAVNDLMQFKANGAKLITKDVKVKDAKGNESLVKEAYVVVDEDAGNGKFKTVETPLKEYASKNVPKYMAEAIFSGSTEKPKETPKNVMRMPALSGGKTSTDNDGGDAESVVSKFNAARNTRVMPWQAKDTGQQT